MQLPAESRVNFKVKSGCSGPVCDSLTALCNLSFQAQPWQVPLQ